MRRPIHVCTSAESTEAHRGLFWHELVKTESREQSFLTGVHVELLCSRTGGLRWSCTATAGVTVPYLLAQWHQSPTEMILAHLEEGNGSLGELPLLCRCHIA